MKSTATTIAAIATAPGVSGIAVARVSGPAARAVCEAIAGPLPPPRVAAMRRFRAGEGEAIDSGLLLFFPAPNSFTGEDVIEFHGHGGRAVIAALLRTILAIPGVRLAEPGEFTRRAFENGKLDLTQVEGLADLLAAETDGQRRQALAQLEGRLSGVVDSIRDRIVRALAMVEAVIDFPDEDDVSANVLPPVRRDLQSLAEEIARLMVDAKRGERVRDGLAVAIAGPPNAGKSSLLNALAKRDVAIVSPIAGTTRDVIEVHLDLDGVAVSLIDTAGLRESEDPVEREGIARAKARVARADLVLWLSDGQSGEPPPVEAPVWRVRTKIDLAGGDVTAGTIAVSAKTGDGLADLEGAIARFARETVGGEPAAVVRARQAEVLRAVADDIASSLLVSDWVNETEIVAEHLRRAVHALGRLTGRVGVEAVLDVVFSSFCIGK